MLLILITSVAFQNGASAKTYYVDPAAGNIENSGDAENPWSTLEEVFKKRKTFVAGDTIFLRDGFHGAPSIRGKFDDFVVILPQTGHEPTFEKVVFSGARKWKLSGVQISPEFSAQYEKTSLITISSSASEILVTNCSCFSVSDNGSWGKHHWSGISCTGASIAGDNNILENNHFLNVKHGILVERTAEHNLIKGNTVENFAADGMRGIGSYNTFEYNVVKNCYDVDDNHDDGFQSYSQNADGVGKSTVYGIVLRGNIIINYEDANQPFKGPLQGIGCFDGMFEDWIVENNIIIVNHWHGISLYGAINCRIINNTVVDLDDNNPGPPWIKITEHKNGTKSTNNVIRNNLTTSIASDAGIGEVDHNVIIRYFSFYDNYFVDYENLDLSLIEGCNAIDVGSTDLAPEIDIVGTKRPQGEGIDAGAYEFIAGAKVDAIESLQPSSIHLSAYPNPFNPGTTITYELERASHVDLSLFNLLGARVETLVDKKQSAGTHRIQFSADGLPSGLYLCKLQTPEDVQSFTLVLCK